MAEFLFEIGLEEVPARMIAGAQAELQRRVVAMLERERLVAAGVASKSFSTPRRLAVWVADVAARQQDASEELLGPAVKIAYKDGVLAPAGIAFAKKAGVAAEALKTVTTPKGDYLAATSVKAGRSAAEVIAEEMPKELAGIYWAKNMYWRTGRPERFVRPVRWLLALLGGDVVPVSYGGFTAGSSTRGHRVLAGDVAIEISAPGEYEQKLLDAKVIADVEVRREKIRKALDRVTRETADGLRWREDHALVDTVTHLTEWPSVVMGSFEAEYLALPEEVLVTVMRDHQKYFAVDDAGGKLAAHFLTVLNTETDAAGEAVIRHGNERVLRARFNDARFFWEFDQRVPLVERVKLLENVTFQKDLGSYAKKTERVWEICKILAQPVQDQFQTQGLTLDFDALREATFLAKTDLTTELVKEFTELQGVIGGLYAEAQGLSPKVSNVIKDQYLPASALDGVPSSYEGAIFGIADRIDTIAGMFSLGMEPSGSKDPFALRRAANAIVRILAESGLRLTVNEVINAANPAPDVIAKLQVFFEERVAFYLREAHLQSYDVVKAVLAAGANDVRDAVARAEAVTAVRGSEDFAAVSAAFKRMKNILAQAKEKGILDERVEISTQTTTMHPAQRLLTQASAATTEKYWKLTADHEYIAALELMATLRPNVDRFFTEVMVMDEDPAVRESRLNLLGDLVRNFSKIADFSEIVTAG